MASYIHRVTIGIRLSNLATHARLACVILAGLVIDCNAAPPDRSSSTEVVVQLAGSKEWMTGLLDRNMSEVSRQNDKVRFVTTGLFSSTLATPSSPKRFELGIGESFHAQDRHVRITFTVKALNSSGVALYYESRFDFRSFQGPLPERHPGIQEESGQVEIAYK
jgi:hypothetical protein